MPAQALRLRAGQEDPFSAKFAVLPNRFDQSRGLGAIYF